MRVLWQSELQGLSGASNSSFELTNEPSLRINREVAPGENRRGR